MIVWHPKVHEHFQECLHFYLVRVDRYDRNSFRRLIKKHLEEHELSAYSVYEVYGAYDILLRLWLPEESAGRFDIGLLENTNLNISQILAFRVAEQPYYWRWDDSRIPAPSAVDVNAVTPDDVRVVREKADPKLKDELRKKNLITDIPPKKNSIQCFIAISQPETMTLKGTYKVLDRIRSVVSEISEKQEIDRTSVYLGLGFTWAFVKIETDEFYSIGSLVMRLWDELYAFGGHTHTHIVANFNYLQNDDISEAAIRAVSGTDLVVNAFIPELYESEVERPKRRQIEDLVRLVIIPLKLSSEAEKILHECLLAIIVNEEFRFVASIITAFGGCEKYLRENRTLFMNNLLSRDEISGTLRKVGIQESRSKKITLGDLLNVYSATIQRANVAKGKELVRKWQDAVEVRNRCQHWEIDVTREWKHALVIFSEFLARYEKLREVVASVVAKKEKVK